MIKLRNLLFLPALCLSFLFSISCSRERTPCVQFSATLEKDALSAGTESRVFYSDGTGGLIEIKAKLDVLIQVDSFVNSPDCRYVLILSSGEGHPWASIYRTDTLTAQRNSEAIKPMTILDPYPLGFSDIKWINPATIEFFSEIDFSQFDKASHRGIYRENSINARWRWDILSDRFEKIR